MGALTREDLNARRTITEYYSFDKDDGLVLNRKIDGKDSSLPIAGVEGFLLGFASHTYDFKGKLQKKFDIYIQDNQNAKKLIQIQFGFHTWQTWIILNKLLTVVDKLCSGEEILLSCSNEGNKEFYDFFIALSGKQLKQKLTRKNDNEKLKFLPKEAPDATSKNEARRNQLINGWYEAIAAVLPFDSDDYYKLQSGAPVSEEPAEDEPQGTNNADNFNDECPY